MTEREGDRPVAQTPGSSPADVHMEIMKKGWEFSKSKFPAMFRMYLWFGVGFFALMFSISGFVMYSFTGSYSLPIVPIIILVICGWRIRANWRTL